LEAALLEGRKDLEVVGESYRQTNLLLVLGMRHRLEHVRTDVHAMLLAEDGNPHDPNAISVWIDGLSGLPAKRSGDYAPSRPAGAAGA
jgi:hypothetical protein